MENCCSQNNQIVKGIIYIPTFRDIMSYRIRRHLVKKELLKYGIKDEEAIDYIVGVQFLPDHWRIPLPRP